MFDVKEIEELNNYIDAFYEEQDKKYVGNKTMEDKLAHIKRSNKLTEIMFKGNNMVLLSAKFHDIGRFPQYEKLGKFDDRFISHNLFGEYFLQNEIKNGNLNSSYELDTIRLVSMYHGLEHLIPERTQLSSEVLDCISKVSIIDEIDNGCIAALGYLEDEIEKDAKNFVANNPELDQRSVSKEVLDFFLRGEKFDKLKYCHTYAEYILFACVLAVKSLRSEYHEVAKVAMMQPCYQYNNALEGYRDLFNRFIDERYAGICFTALGGFFQLGNDYVFDFEKMNEENLDFDFTIPTDNLGANTLK